MSWTKIGDELPAAARDLSDAAFRTHIEALCWSNNRLLDLMIPKRDVRRFAETADPITAVEELVAAGWWQDCGDAGWFIGCRFADWQLESTVIEKRRANAALRQRRARLHRAGDHSLCEKCPAVTRDAMRDQTRDPGRVGSGREEELPPGREEQQLEHEHGHTCPCSSCEEDRAWERERAESNW